MKLRMLICLTSIIAITIVSGLVQGSLSGRWGPSVDLVAAGQQLRSLPREFGPWQLQTEREMEPDVVEALQCTGHVYGRYANSQTGQTVDMALIVGPPGPTSVHVAEICFSSQDYQQQGQRQRVRVQATDGSRTGEFWSLTFRSNDVDGFPLSVWYGWSDGRQWQAPENPRVSHSSTKVLYKIQVAGNVREALSGQSPQQDPCQSFLQSLLAVSDLPGTGSQGVVKK